jgi:hypothetical protein
MTHIARFVSGPSSCARPAPAADAELFLIALEARERRGLSRSSSSKATPVGCGRAAAQPPPCRHVGIRIRRREVLEVVVGWNPAPATTGAAGLRGGNEEGRRWVGSRLTPKALAELARPHCKEYRTTAPWEPHSS